MKLHATTYLKIWPILQWELITNEFEREPAVQSCCRRWARQPVQVKSAQIHGFTRFLNV